MRRLAVVTIVLVGCGHPAPPHPTPLPSSEAPPPAKPITPVAPMPTTDPVPDDQHIVVAMSTDEYEVDVYDDGYLRWTGKAGVRSIGERRARIPKAQEQALVDVFLHEHFVSLQAPDQSSDSCVPSNTMLHFASGDLYNQLTDDHCPGLPAFTRIEDAVARYAVTDAFIHGNPLAPGGPLPDGEHLLLHYARDMCYGQCPVFELTVYDDGTLVWNGIAYVVAAGEKRATLAADQIKALIAAFDTAQFDKLDDEGKIPVAGGNLMVSSCTDTSHTITTYQHGGQHKTLDDAHCDYDPKNPLFALESAIEKVTAIGPWIRTPQVFLTYQQISCKSGCPAYVVTVDDEGHVVWNGETGVAAVGERTATLTDDQLRALSDLFTLAKFDDLASPSPTCTDNAHTVITLDEGNGSHAIDDPHCTGTPALADLESKVDSALSLDAWIYGDRPPIAKAPKHGHIRKGHRH